MEFEVSNATLPSRNIWRRNENGSCITRSHEQCCKKLLAELIGNALYMPVAFRRNAQFIARLVTAWQVTSPPILGQRHPSSSRSPPLRPRAACRSSRPSMARYRALWPERLSACPMYWATRKAVRTYRQCRVLLQLLCLEILLLIPLALTLRLTL